MLIFLYLQLLLWLSCDILKVQGMCNRPHHLEHQTRTDLSPSHAHTYVTLNTHQMLEMQLHRPHPLI